MSLRKQQPSATTTSNETHRQIGSFIGEERNCSVQPGRVPPLVRTQMALLRTQVPLVRTQMALVRTQMVLVRTQTALCTDTDGT
jgi:hypothetical protein